jgi:hypothetical protein
MELAAAQKSRDFKSYEIPILLYSYVFDSKAS